MSPGHLHEQLELMTPGLASYNFEWPVAPPRWRDHDYATTPHRCPCGKLTQVIYNLEGGFGVRPDDLRKRFYFRRFPARIET